jgi:hypothetical protein
MIYILFSYLPKYDIIIYINYISVMMKKIKTYRIVALFVALIMSGCSSTAPEQEQTQEKTPTPIEVPDNNAIQKLPPPPPPPPPPGSF